MRCEASYSTGKRCKRKAVKWHRARQRGCVLEFVSCPIHARADFRPHASCRGRAIGGDEDRELPQDGDPASLEDLEPVSVEELRAMAVSNEELKAMAVTPEEFAAHFQPWEPKKP